MIIRRTCAVCSFIRQHARLTTLSRIELLKKRLHYLQNVCSSAYDALYIYSSVPAYIYFVFFSHIHWVCFNQHNSERRRDQTLATLNTCLDNHMRRMKRETKLLYNIERQCRFVLFFMIYATETQANMVQGLCMSEKEGYMWAGVFLFTRDIAVSI